MKKFTSLFILLFSVFLFKGAQLYPFSIEDTKISLKNNRVLFAKDANGVELGFVIDIDNIISLISPKGYLYHLNNDGTLYKGIHWGLLHYTYPNSDVDFEDRDFIIGSDKIFTPKDLWLYLSLSSQELTPEKFIKIFGNKKIQKSAYFIQSDFWFEDGGLFCNEEKELKIIKGNYYRWMDIGYGFGVKIIGEELGLKIEPCTYKKVGISTNISLPIKFYSVYNGNLETHLKENGYNFKL